MLLAWTTIKVDAGEGEMQRGASPSAGMLYRASSHSWLHRIIVLTGIAALTAAGCVSTSNVGPVSGADLTAPAAFARERLIGRWGIASFHTDKDRKRTESEARPSAAFPTRSPRGRPTG